MTTDASGIPNIDCDCECHLKEGIIHFLPCCSTCSDCGRHIQSKYIYEHPAKCEKRLQRLRNPKDRHKLRPKS